MLTLSDVLLDTGQAQLKSGARRSLDQMATFFLQDNPERRVEIIVSNNDAEIPARAAGSP